MALDVFGTPVASAFILTLVLVWVRIFHGIQDPKDLHLSYQNVVRRSQWWRLLSFSWCHQSFIHLIINVSSLWCCRHIEAIYGSFFFLRYSLLLIAVEGCLSLIILSFLQNPTRRNSNDDISPGNAKLIGASGLVMAWVSFVGVRSLVDEAQSPLFGLYYFFGILPVSWYLAPLLLLTIAPLFPPRESILSNGSGFVGGYLLVSGIINILPNLFWTICCVINILLFLSFTRSENVYGSEEDSGSSRHGGGDVNGGLLMLLGIVADSDTVPVHQLASQDSTTASPENYGSSFTSTLEQTRNNFDS